MNKLVAFLMFLGGFLLAYMFFRLEILPIGSYEPKVKVGQIWAMKEKNPFEDSIFFEVKKVKRDWVEIWFYDNKKHKSDTSGFYLQIPTLHQVPDSELYKAFDLVK